MQGSGTGASPVISPPGALARCSASGGACQTGASRGRLAHYGVSAELRPDDLWKLDKQVLIRERYNYER